ncbi:MAG TPA: hypothetical protein DCZ03_08210, partial [Gammaproteobacteria bacterium]|nr:hypothetical protein [Gammaproteobacteria bacterium]
DDDDDDDTGAAETSTNFSVSVTSPDGLATAALGNSSPQQLLAQFLLSKAHAAEETSLTEDAFQVALVNAAGIVTEIVTPLSWSQEADGTYVLELPGGLRLDCVVGVGLDGSVELVVGQPLPNGLLVAPTTNPLLDVDVASTASYQNFLDTVEDSIDLTSQTDLTVEEVQSIIDTIQDMDLPAPQAGQTLEQYIAAAIAASQEVVEREVYVAENSSAANLGELISTEGIHWFEGEEEEIGELLYGVFSYDQNTQVTSETEFFWNGSAFEEETDLGEDDWILGDSGWTQIAGMFTVVSALNADGTITLVSPESSSSTEQMSGIMVDLEGQSILDFFLGDEDVANWTDVIGANSTFSAGAVGYDITWTFTGDFILMWDWDCQNPENTGGICNTVWHSDGDGDAGNDTFATTLESIISSTASATSDPSAINAVVLPDGNGEYSVELVEGGVANIFQFDWQAAPPVATNVGTSTWVSVSLDNGVTYIELAMNDLLQGIIDFDEDETLLFTEHEGYVRYASKEMAGTSESEWVFNQAAKDEILNAALIPCIAADSSVLTDFSSFENAVVQCGGTQGQGGFTEANVSGLTFTNSEGDTITFNADGTGMLTEEGIDESISWEVDSSGYLVITFAGGDTDTVALVKSVAGSGMSVKAYEVDSGNSDGEIGSDVLWISQ